MSFVAPFFLLGLVAIVLPVWLHRLQTQNPETEPFGSTMLLEASEQRVHLKTKLRYRLLLALVWWYSARPRASTAVTGMFLTGYGLLRLFSELFRSPDPHLMFIAFGWLTMGQMLSVPMVLLGIAFLWHAHKVNQPAKS